MDDDNHISLSSMNGRRHIHVDKNEPLSEQAKLSTSATCISDKTTSTINTDHNQPADAKRPSTNVASDDYLIAILGRGRAMAFQNARRKQITVATTVLPTTSNHLPPKKARGRASVFRNASRRESTVTTIAQQQDLSPKNAAVINDRFADSFPESNDDLIPVPKTTLNSTGNGDFELYSNIGETTNITTEEVTKSDKTENTNTISTLPKGRSPLSSGKFISLSSSTSAIPNVVTEEMDELTSRTRNGHEINVTLSMIQDRLTEEYYDVGNQRGSTIPNVVTEEMDELTPRMRNGHEINVTLSMIRDRLTEEYYDVGNQRGSLILSAMIFFLFLLF